MDTDQNLFVNNNIHIYLKLLLFFSAWSTVLIDFCTFLSLREPVPRPPGPNRRKKSFSPRNSDNNWNRKNKTKLSVFTVKCTTEAPRLRKVTK